MRKFIVISIVVLMIAGFVITSSALATPVAIDVKPQSCPNPLNVKSEGVLPVAILGAEDFDVTQIDPASIRVWLEDIVGEGVAPLRWDWEDVATPFGHFTGKDDCMMDCNELGPDGLMDLTLKFDIQEIISALGDVENGECLILYLEGLNGDGDVIYGEDVILIIKKVKP